MNLLPSEMTDEQLVEECKNYDIIMEYYQRGQLSLSVSMLKTIQADIREVYEEIKFRMELQREMSEVPE